MRPHDATVCFVLTPPGAQDGLTAAPAANPLQTEDHTGDCQQAGKTGEHGQQQDCHCPIGDALGLGGDAGDRTGVKPRAQAASLHVYQGDNSRKHKHKRRITDQFEQQFDQRPEDFQNGNTLPGWHAGTHCSVSQNSTLAVKT